MILMYDLATVEVLNKKLISYESSMHGAEAFC
jgi:hypothetical protein